MATLDLKTLDQENLIELSINKQSDNRILINSDDH